MRRIAAATALLLAIAACTDAPAEDPVAQPTPTAAPTSAPTATEPTTTPTASPSPTAPTTPDAIDVSTVPDEVTVEYVEAVVNAINAASGETYAAILTQPTNPLGATPDGTAERFRALYEGDALTSQLAQSEAFARDDAVRVGLLPAEQYRGLRYSFEQLSYVEDGCIIAIGRVDRAGTEVGGGAESFLSAVSLARADDGGADGTVNPTPWRVRDTLQNTNSDGQPNSDQFMLTSTLETFGDALDNECTGEGSRVE